MRMIKWHVTLLNSLGVQVYGDVQSGRCLQPPAALGAAFVLIRNKIQQTCVFCHIGSLELASCFCGWLKLERYLSRIPGWAHL